MSWIELTDVRRLNLAYVAKIGRPRGAGHSVAYAADGAPLGEILDFEGIGIDALVGVIVPAAAGADVVVVSWDRCRPETEFRISRRTVIAWRVDDIVTLPIVAGEAINEKSGQAFLIPHPDGTFERPFLSVWDSIEEAVAELKEDHQKALMRTAVD